MNTPDKLVTGGVYNLKVGLRAIKTKVLVFDELEVLYDEWYSEAGAWLSDKFRGRGCYSRTTREYFDRSSTFIHVETFTEKQFQKYRPDLPIRFGRLRHVSWSSVVFNTEDDFKKHLGEGAHFSNDRVNCAELVLYPYGIKGAVKKGERVKALNGESFTIPELLWRANNIQSNFVKEASRGIGLYRLGLEKGLQSYYIGEYVDWAGFLKE
jgi:hypothetical protein